MKKANVDIREEMDRVGVYIWQVADIMGIHENTLCSRMRKELPEEDKKEIFFAIMRAKELYL